MKFLPSWFRIHLSTAIVLMIAASVMLGLNLTKRLDEGGLYDCYGWPKTCLLRVELEAAWRVDEWLNRWDPINLALNILTAAVLLTVVAVVLEKRIAIQNRLQNEKH